MGINDPRTSDSRMTWAITAAVIAALVILWMVYANTSSKVSETTRPAPPAATEPASPAPSTTPTPAPTTPPATP